MNVNCFHAFSIKRERMYHTTYFTIGGILNRRRHFKHSKTTFLSNGSEMAAVACQQIQVHSAHASIADRSAITAKLQKDTYFKNKPRISTVFITKIRYCVSESMTIIGTFLRAHMGVPHHILLTW